MKNISKTIPILTALVLAGCGGGGGGTSASTNTSTPVGVSITSTNAPDTVAYAYSGIEDLDSESGTSAALATGVSIQAPGTGLISASLRQLYKGLEAQPFNNLVTGVTTSNTYACSGGGSISLTVTAAISGQVSNGDSLSITGNNCVESGDVMNGRVTFGFNNLAGTIASTTAWSATLTITFDKFSVQSGGETVYANGDMKLGVNQTAAQVVTSTVEGTSLQMNLTPSGGTTVSRTLTNYKFTGTQNISTYTSSANFTITGNSPRFGDAGFTVTTSTPFTRTGINNPSSGSLKVLAAGNTSATLTALDSTNVKIELDKNGDGAIDETIYKTWSELRSRI